MKNSIVVIVLPFMVLLIACKKDKKNDPEPEAPAVDNYTSLSDFYEKNGAQKQTFTFDAAAGGSFVTPQSTTINIPPNAFKQAKGTITLEFKDLYKKSDMLFTDMGTTLDDGSGLVSGGEVFIKALNNGIAVSLDSAEKITVRLPVKNKADADMKAYVARQYSVNTNYVWSSDPVNTVTYIPSVSLVPAYYQLDLSMFSSPLNNGTWYNCDHVISGYQPTHLTVNTGHPYSSQSYASPRVYIVFKNINTVVSLFQSFDGKYHYDFAALGLECSVVTIIVNEGKLFSSIVPITISANQTMNIDLTETTTEKFKEALKALD